MTDVQKRFEDDQRLLAEYLVEYGTGFWPATYTAEERAVVAALLPEALATIWDATVAAETRLRAEYPEAAALRDLPTEARYDARYDRLRASLSPAQLAASGDALWELGDVRRGLNRLAVTPPDVTPESWAGSRPWPQGLTTPRLGGDHQNPGCHCAGRRAITGITPAAGPPTSVRHRKRCRVG